MKIVYHRSHKGKTPKREQRELSPKSFTLVIDNLPTRDDLILAQKDMLEREVTWSFRAGYSVTHPHDEFNRKVGHEFASNTVEGKVNSINGLQMPRRLMMETATVAYLASVPNGGFRVGLNVDGLDFEIRYSKGGQATIAEIPASNFTAHMINKRRAPK